MEDDNLNPAGEEKEPGKHAKAAFCEKLLSCCACGKIYFSRQPIALLTLSRKDFYICNDCSAMITCSRCNQMIPPEATLVVENHSNNSLEFLCSSCRDTVIISSGLLLNGIRKRFGRGNGSYFMAIGRFFKRIMRINVWPGRRGSKP
jgi:hypothetical protein